MGALAPEEAFRIQPTEHCDGFLQGARLLPFICHFGSFGSKITIAFFSLALVTAAQSADPATALALEQAGKLPEAAEAWRAVVKSTPRDAAAWAGLGLVLSRMQNYSEAGTAYRKALALNPRLPGVQLNLGLAEFKSNNFEGAIPPLRAALAADSKNTQGRTLLGLSYYGIGKFADAAKYLAQASAADPGNAELHNDLAQSCLSAKTYDCAMQAYSWILQRTPDSAASHMLLGEALDGLGKTPEAITEFEAAVKADSRVPNVNFGLGYLYWKLRRCDQAAEAFENEIAADPQNAQALAYLGDVELKRENAEKALSLLTRAIAIRTDLRVAQLDLGVILTQQKKYPEALKALRRAEQLDPEQPEVHFRLGRLYQAMGDNATAQKEYARVKQLHQKVQDAVVDKMSGGKTQAEP